MAKNCDAPINTVKGANAARWQNGKPMRVVREIVIVVMVTHESLWYRYETTREEKHQTIVHKRETDMMDCIR